MSVPVPPLPTLSRPTKGKPLPARARCPPLIIEYPPKGTERTPPQVRREHEEKREREGGGTTMAVKNPVGNNDETRVIICVCRRPRPPVIPTRRACICHLAPARERERKEGHWHGTARNIVAITKHKKSGVPSIPNIRAGGSLPPSLPLEYKFEEGVVTKRMKKTLQLSLYTLSAFPL